MTERSNIIEINELPPIPDVHASMVSLNELSNYKSIESILNDCQSFLPNDILESINAVSGNLNCFSTKTIICSPHSMRANFARSLPISIKKFERERLTSLKATKASIISCLLSMDFKINKSDNVAHGLKAIVNANDKKVLKAEIKSLLNSIESGHTKIFAGNITNACARASSSIGFKKIEIKPVRDKMEVIATNAMGQRLITEVTIDNKTKIVNANTEVIGIHDGTCKLIIKNFNEELKKMGIKIGSEKTISTISACDIPYSKILDTLDIKRKNKKDEIKRTQKLNISKKLKV
jgi:hypothetical protein